MVEDEGQYIKNPWLKTTISYSKIDSQYNKDLIENNLVSFLFIISLFLINFFLSINQLFTISLNSLFFNNNANFFIKEFELTFIYLLIFNI